MYIKKEHRELIEKMKNCFKIPKDFEKFAFETAKLNYGLILKSGNTHTCTYCNTSFKSKKKVKNLEKCPKCHNIYEIRGAGIRYICNELKIGLLDKVDNKLVIRIFNVWLTYNEGKYSISYKEFYRELFDGTRFVHSCFLKGLGFEKVYRYSKNDCWRYASNYTFFNAIFYYKNIKKLLNNTKYKYSMVWDLLKNTKKTYIDLEGLLQNSLKYQSIELLTKMKLYNLALNASEYNVKGNFEKRFGISKDYYTFMKKHNVTSDELEVLKLFKIKDIDIINDLASNYHIKKLKRLAKLTTINRFIEYRKMLGGKLDIDMYIDYLENAKILGFDLKDKRYLFPENLKRQHDLLMAKVENNESEYFDKAVENRFNELNENIYENRLYIIRPPKNREDFIEEGKQQKHCVYTNYFAKYAKGATDIYFMREKNNPAKSLVTVEVLDNKIVQKKTKGNGSPNNLQNLFLNEWENNILRKAA